MCKHFYDLPLYQDDAETMLEKHNITKLVEMSESRPSTQGTYSSPRYKIYNTFVWLQGEKAVAEAQCMMGGYNTVNGVEYHRLGWARLLYRVVKENGVWKIKGMDCRGRQARNGTEGI